MARSLTVAYPKIRPPGPGWVIAVRPHRVQADSRLGLATLAIVAIALN